MMMELKAQSKGGIVTCAIIGDEMVGKTSLALTFMKEKLPDNHVSTVFDNFAGIQLVAGNKYTVSMFDTTSQQDYEELRIFTYKESEVIVVCYSVLDRDSYSSVREYWFHEILKYVRGSHKKPVILVATHTDQRNKSDPNVDNPVSTSEGEQLAKDIGAEKFIECSAVTRKGVSEIFENVIMCAMKQRKKKPNFLKQIFSKLAE
ncbi:hypothetical protein CHS0354_007684 [Potamilus streckersoni]|uniref:Uncharacterized protein n=1 Tax=Potamilus streckersoni TaxID=2493646 RepID=A0AAE0VWJ3_9BIVA|nr:hypothetical protein CHS0354_007684 [Potamilus streckersoni]